MSQAINDNHEVATRSERQSELLGRWEGADALDWLQVNGELILAPGRYSVDLPWGRTVMSLGRIKRTIEKKKMRRKGK